MRSKALTGVVLAFFALLVLPLSLAQTTCAIEKGSFRFVCGERGITSLANPADPFGAQITDAKRPLAVTVRYQSGTEWKDLKSVAPHVEPAPQAGSVRYTFAGKDAPVKLVETFKTDGATLDWSIEVENAARAPLTIGDLAIDVPAMGPRGEDPKSIFERSFLRHQFISGSGSFMYFVRPSGAPPFLMVTVLPGTQLEYFEGGRGGALQFIHSGLSGNNEKRGTWRQEHTLLKLGPAGARNSKTRYGFRFRWANSYDELRAILYDEGLFDVRAVPGMSIPQDLTARFAVRTKARIESVTAEFPAQTAIAAQGERQGYRIYEVAFRRLGENKLTIRHDGGRQTYLEYFVTEPVETLIKKRAAFLVNRQQIRDTSKWWDGVFGPYDMRAKAVRTIDDPDIFKGRMVYVLTCDDPGLSKAPYLAAKNVSFPDRKEIEGIEYYLQHFVWGKLQRTDEEIPYPYGVYGTPEWYTNRDPERRAKATKANLDKVHVWRSYDYPHIVMLYFHMYEIAKKYPQMSKYLDASGYLERAYQTARAFYIYPYEIFSSYYETYKWGLYNELVVLQLADALEREGFPQRAAWLRSEWEKKVKYFVYDDEYPFRSEYAFDRTAFESTYAFAKYGATHEMQPDQHLWWDIKLKKWYSHPLVRRADSRAFMDRQLAAGLTVRGWLEPSYYQLGADPGLSYMAAMGGWGILDYGLDFAPQPYDWLQLGYASYLSSWSLMNTGTPESNFGFWFPGKENDGAASWQFMSAKWGRAWMGSEVPRGPWNYDGEIDLGFGGALRMAATVLTRDPVFDWTAYGGTLAQDGNALTIIPRDGLRQRFAAVLPDPMMPWSEVRRFKLALDRDGFAAGQAIATDKHLDRIAFILENRTGDEHATTLRLSFPFGAGYDVLQDGKKLELAQTGDSDYPWQAQINVGATPARMDIVRRQDK